MARPSSSGTSREFIRNSREPALNFAVVPESATPGTISGQSALMPNSSLIRPGLVSITFRSLSVPEIVSLARKAKLEAIEWGGDVHVPPGDVVATRAAREACEQANIAVSAYGSYYRAGGAPGDFDAVLASAVALGAPTIRIWAGHLGSEAADEAHVANVVADIARVCDLAAANGLTITLEYHGGTLTDSLESTLSLLNATDRPNLLSGWQPRNGASPETGSAEIRQLRPWLGNIHVFQWWPTGADRHPLAEGADRWKAFFETIAEDGQERFALLEFVKGDQPEQLVADATTLRELVTP
ncbi:MAG: sugar phosphate isomerase [Phycisphaerales bacterium]|nr:sugar phosphate isomerase [Phycisphaerales bacterium]